MAVALLKVRSVLRAPLLLKAWDALLVPVLTLVISIFAFGLQIPRVGFYLDDWMILNAYNQGGAQRVFEYAFYGNRPLIFWIWIIGFKLFGFVSAYWQIWALFWRWLTVIIFWLGWRELWPKASRQVALVALLFAVYPLFRQQASALTFSFHWICFFLSGLSLYLMILAVRRPRAFVPLMLGSLLAGGIQLFSQEFFVGIELLRPVVLWLALRPAIPEWKARLKRAALDWSPYLLMVAAYLIWRIALMPNPGSDRNTPVLLGGLLSSPLSSLAKLATMALQDVVEILQGVWYKSYQPDLFVLTPLSSVAAWGIAAIVFALALFCLWRSRSAITVNEVETGEPWYASAIPFGLIAMLLGFAPGWAIGRHIYDLTGVYNDRFGLAATFGAAILIVALLELLLKKQSYHLVLVCLLIGLGAGQNVRFMNNYRYSWEKQQQLFWQLKWRAPGLKEPTAILGDGALISYMGSWATTSAFLQMYEPTKNSYFNDYWYFDVTKQNIDAIASDKGQVGDDTNYLHYRGTETDILVISFEPEKLQCLWVLSDRDKVSRTLPASLKDALSASNLDRILPGPDAPLRQDIFGAEIPHDWCYYFQKADLARQFQDWGTVVSLWKQAQQRGKHPHVGEEYLPFIEGFAHTGDWQAAIDLTRKSYFPKYDMRAYVCQAWQRVAQTTGDSPEKRQAISTVIDNFECQDELKP